MWRIVKFILLAVVGGTHARGHYGHSHVGGGVYEGPRGGMYHYGDYGQRLYL